MNLHKTIRGKCQTDVFDGYTDPMCDACMSYLDKKIKQDTRHVVPREWAYKSNGLDADDIATLREWGVI